MQLNTKCKSKISLKIEFKSKQQQNQVKYFNEDSGDFSGN